MQLKLIMRHLQQAGIEHVEGVSSAREAQEHIAQYPPDLVITAMYLPDMSAPELIARVQSDDPDSKIAFMLISSETGHQALEPIRQAGVIAILPKPFSHQDLERAIRATLDVIEPDELELNSYDATELRVLVVDDSFTSRNHIARVLASMGIVQIDTVGNGREAVEQLAAQSYDLVVTDLNMPEMDGQQLVQYIREDIGDTILPILMATTENNEARLGQVQQAGVSAILDKPFEPQTIREMLYRILES